MNVSYLLGWRKCWGIQRNGDRSIILNHYIHVSPKLTTCVAVVTVGRAENAALTLYSIWLVLLSQLFKEPFVHRL